MTEFWNIIVESNTFNFVILVIIFAIIFIKIDFAKIITTLKYEVAKSIEDARAKKTNSEKELKHAKKMVKNTDAEIQAQLDDAKTSASSIVKQIKLDSESQIERIGQTTKKVILSEEKKLSISLTEKTLDSAIDLAKKNIIKELKNSPELHKKFIEDGINEIEKVDICK